MTLWTQQTAADATNGKTTGTWEALRVEIDSRKVRTGDLFVALAGERFDGHEFVSDALAKGAVAAIVSKPDMRGPLLQVADTQKALEDLARFARARSSAKIVGVTGSVGKTSTKEMLRIALSAHGKTYATSGNYNNHIGTPLCLANMPLDTEFAVFEMGMNHAGEIAPLAAMVRPDIAVITNVEAVHMEFFASLDEIAKAKAEIFEGVSAQGTAVLNADNALFSALKQTAQKRGISRIIACGSAENADYRLLAYRALPAGCEITATLFGKEIRFSLSAVGKHWATTALLTLAATHALKLDDSKTAQALSEFSEIEGRGRVLRLAGGALLIDDSYNASPASMKAAFAKTAEVWENAGKKGRKLAALGDMLELGSDTPALHVGLAQELAAQKFQSVFTAGNAMQYLHDALPDSMRGAHAASCETLLPLLMRELKPDDVLLVKGSHGSHMYKIARALLAQAGEKQHAV